MRVGAMTKKIEDDPMVWAGAKHIIDSMTVFREKGMTVSQLLEALFAALCAMAATIGMPHEQLRQWIVASLEASYGGWVHDSKALKKSQDPS